MRISRIIFITASLLAAVSPAQARDDRDLDDVTMRVLEDFVADKDDDRVRIIELPASAREERHSARERDTSRHEGREADSDSARAGGDDRDSMADESERDAGETHDRDDSRERDDDNDRHDDRDRDESDDRDSD